MFDFEEIKKAMGELEEDTLRQALEEVIASGGGDAPRALEAMQQGMDTVGNLYEEGEYFVGDLIYAGEIMTDAMAILRPALTAESGGSLGKMIICTVRDDMHDIGKNIVRTLLEAGGFEVIDLGIDTPAEKVVEAAQKNDVKIIALSGVLTLSLDAMKDTVDAFRAAGLRDDVKIIIGGAPVSEAACARIGADEWAHSPQKTLRVCKEWSEQ